MRRTMIGLSLVLLLSMASSNAFAADPPAGASHIPGEVAKHNPRPVVPDPSPLAGSMLILIAGMFLAAATVGPVVRYHAPEEAPEASSHDEHAGHGSHGHGHG